MALPDLTGQNIQDTYKRVLTVGDSGNMYDGTGSLFIPLSASVEITKEVSSSFADTAAALVMEPSIAVTHITASGDISSSGTIIANQINLDNSGRIYFNEASATDQYIQGQDSNIIIEGDNYINLRADLGVRFEDLSNNPQVVIDGALGNISASGTISASAIYADTIYTSGSSLYVGSQKFTQKHLTDLKEGKSIRDTSGLSATTYTLADGREISRQYEQRFNRWAPNITFLGGDADAEYSETDSIPQTYVDLTDRSFRSIVRGGSTKIIQTINSITLKGNVTASGDISSSGTGTFNRLDVEEYIYHKDDNTYIRFLPDRIIAVASNNTVLNLNVGADLVEFGHIGKPSVVKGSTVTLTGDVTASGNISSSGTITANEFVGGGSGITGLSAAAISTYNSSGDNRVVTSVNSSTVQGEANLTYDGSGLNVTGHITASGNISSSGHISSSGLYVESKTITDFLKLNSLGSSANPIKLIFEKSGTEQGIIEYNRNGDLELYNSDNDGGVMIDGSTSAGGDLYVANTGKVGIGTTTPTEKLTVEGNISASGDIIVAGNITNNIENNTLDLYGGADTTNDAHIKLHGNANYWGSIEMNYGYEPTYSYLKIMQGSNESLRITNLGKVGIGNSVPTEKLTVEGNISSSGTVIARDVLAGGVFEAGLRTKGLKDLPTGTIVVWEEDKLIPCYKSEDELVMGVIRQGRDEPIVLGAEPVLVTGKVNVGNYIVTSDKQGYGKSVNVGYLFKKNLFGKVIGQALESSEGENSLIKCMIRKM